MIFSSSQEKSTVLNGFLGQMLPSLFSATRASFYQPVGKATYSGLVFCPHVNGEYGVVEIADRIQAQDSIPTSYYSGKQPKFWSAFNWNRAKQSVARRFKRNELPLLICTKAFGMGIDKPNIRYTVHFGLPNSIESFYQEAGRAGRDRRPAHCCIIVSNDDPRRTQRLLDPSTRVEDISSVINHIPRAENDDITRALYFHINAFRGVSTETKEVTQVLRQLGDCSSRGTRILMFPSMDRSSVEKGLHRLLTLGVIEDYTIDYSCDEFTVRASGASKSQVIDSYGKYIAGYLESRKEVEIQKAAPLLNYPYPEFLLKMVQLLLSFIYEVIEKGRRRALNEMLAATVNPSDKAIRRRVLSYLEATEHTELLDDILTQADAGLKRITEAFDLIRSPNEASELRGQVSRYLESYPDHPGLLMLRALAEMFCRDKNALVARQNFISSLISASESYGINGEVLFSFAARSIHQLFKRDATFAKEMVEVALTSLQHYSLARVLVSHLPPELATKPAMLLLGRVVRQCQDLVFKQKGGKDLVAGD